MLKEFRFAHRPYDEFLQRRQPALLAAGGGCAGGVGVVNEGFRGMGVRAGEACRFSAQVRHSSAPRPGSEWNWWGRTVVSWPKAGSEPLVPVGPKLPHAPSSHDRP